MQVATNGNKEIHIICKIMHEAILYIITAYGNIRLQKPENVTICDYCYTYKLDISEASRSRIIMKIVPAAALHYINYD